MFFGSASAVCAQEITEENYRKADNEIWEKLEKETASFGELFRSNPELRDSLMSEYTALSEEANRLNEETAIRYAAVPSGLRRVFMLRLDLPKDTLRAVLARIPEEMRDSPYGKSIAAHIEAEQIEAGSVYCDFDATAVDGTPFRLSSLAGKKNILLLYGGLDCMGQKGREFLADFYARAHPENFEIVVYCPVSNPENLQKMVERYPADYLFVSDFLQDHSPFKIIYGAQATPTCFLIDKSGKVSIKSIGLPVEGLTQMFEKGALN